MTRADKMNPGSRLREIEEQILAATPPIEPAACHWLTSNAGVSYCRTHAWEARWQELPTFGPCPEDRGPLHRSDFEDIIADGIDGGFCASPSDTPEASATCGCTLDHLLTHGGKAEELVHFEHHPIEPGDVITGEMSYALTRIFMDLDTPCADPEMQASAVKLAEDTWQAIQHQKRHLP